MAAEPLCVGFSEINKYAIQIYQKQFPKHKNYGDATNINTNELPDFDLLVGGFPCQAFSVAGKRKGFDDTRGTLFFEIARIVKAKRPKTLLLENVKGLLSHNKGETFRVILQTLDELGYHTEWMVLNSKFFGVPQNRERVFIIGSLRGRSRPEILPFRESSKNTLGERKISPCLDASYYKGTSPSHAKQGRPRPYVVAMRGRNPSNPSDRTTGSHTEQRLEPNSQGISNTLSSVTKDNLVMENNLNDEGLHTYGKESKLDDRTLESQKELWVKKRSMCGLQDGEENRHSSQERRLARQQERKSRGNMSQLSLSNSQSNKDLHIRELQQQEKKIRLLREAQSEIQKVGESQNGKKQSILSSARIRRLTCLECERLQSFPDNWTAEGTEGKISDTQRYKCLGNAVTVNVIRELMKHKTWQHI